MADDNQMDGNNQASELMLMEEVAVLTRIPVNSLRYYRQRNKGEGPPSFKLGKRVFYRRSSVLAWIEEQFKKSEAS